MTVSRCVFKRPRRGVQGLMAWLPDQRNGQGGAGVSHRGASEKSQKRNKGCHAQSLASLSGGLTAHIDQLDLKEGVQDTYWGGRTQREKKQGEAERKECCVSGPRTSGQVQDDADEGRTSRRSPQRFVGGKPSWVREKKAGWPQGRLSWDAGAYARK